MRESHKAASGHAAAALKQEYAEMLRAMMTAMKDNFEVFSLHQSNPRPLLTIAGPPIIHIIGKIC